MRRVCGSGSLIVMLAAACGEPKGESFDCEDLAAPEASRFSAVAELVTTPSPKGCSTCHNTTTPVYGYNLEGPGVAYDALTSKFDLVYRQVASGRMPDDGVRWSPSDLQLLRSWYCYGGVYEE